MKKSSSQQSTLPSTNKDIQSYRIIATVRQLFQSGRKVTVKEINEITRSNETRKIISSLRSVGWNISDVRLSDNRKFYWLVETGRQISLFTESEVINE